MTQSAKFRKFPFIGFPCGAIVIARVCPGSIARSGPVLETPSARRPA